MIFYEHPLFKMSRKFLLFVGQWPYDDGNAKHLIRAVICLLFIMTCFTELPSQLVILSHTAHHNKRLEVEKRLASKIMYEVITWNYKFKKVILTFPSFALVLIPLQKYFTYWIQGETIKEILERIKLDWNNLRSKREVEIMINDTAESWFLGKAYIIIGYAGVTGFVCLLFFPIILDTISPLNETRSQRLLSQSGYLTNAHGYSVYVILHIQCTCVVAITTVLASDLFFIMVTHHICALYGVIGFRLEHIIDDTHYISNCHKEEVFRKRIMSVVSYHLKIIEYADLLMSCYKVPFGSLFFITICVIASLLSNVHDYLLEEEYILALAFSLEVLLYYSAMLIDFVPAQRLVNYSSDLFHKLYNSNWYKAPVRTQKLLLFMLQRIQKPFIPSVGGLLDMTYEVWATIVQTSLSYFMVISSVRE